MSPPIIGAIGLGVLLILMIGGMPIGFAMALVGFVGFAFLVKVAGALNLLATIPYATVASSVMSLIPMFMLMGEIIFRARITTSLYDSANKWVGNLPGGLAIATVGACAGFAAACGSSLAPAAMFSKVALPEMRRYKYDYSLATGAIAAGGTLGILIPPSIALVVLGILTSQSIGKLLIAGIVPGILLASLFILTIYVLCRLNPRLGPSVAAATWKERLVALREVWPTLSLFLLVIGGLYLGIFTSTECAAVGAFGALLIALMKRQLNWESFIAAVGSTFEITSMIFVILIGAYIFGAFLAISELPLTLAELAIQSKLPPVIVLVFILFIYLILGSISDIISSVVLTIPIVYPIIIALGFDPIWFGVIVVIMLEMGLITPPIGLNVFIISGVAKDIPISTIFRGIVPFAVAMVVCVAILIAFPQIVLFLPTLMKGG